MQLKIASNLGSYECFACKSAGLPIKLWPLYIIGEPQLIPSDDLHQLANDRIAPAPTYTCGEWRVYLSVTGQVTDRRSGNPVRSKHASHYFCYPHWRALAHDWQYVALEEVQVYELTHRVYDRMENV